VARNGPLGVRPPSFVPSQPEQAATALNALAALYRDYLEQHALDSRCEKSVDVGDTDAPKED